MLKIIFSVIDRTIPTRRFPPPPTDQVNLEETQKSDTTGNYQNTWSEPDRPRKPSSDINRRTSNIKRKASPNSGYRSSGLWHQLLVKVSSDTATAERIISHLRRKHPGETDRWYLEKAIFDLDRDKGRY
ncbi:hypothetical protein VB711_16975 [Cronbergia sp. UHCC 0137]|uniref:hypothetical protein n=1 Tax=Cronbergia sp. UHCC 0137 TaxID=3110239 RepID=UPI002B1EA59E|nr:hypothetical protein [Cronbergia sp. UHCC 0137]MEA5619520.1 hypothetical protein [Cronbergia sp. UHCC 0137]